MKNGARTGWALVLTALLAACGQNPPRPSEAQQAAVQWNQRAQTAYARGDYAQALAHYQQALAANRAIEDVNGIARELINLAVVHRKLGRPAPARAALDEILVPAGIPFTAGQRAEATYRLALFAAEDGDAVRARTLGEQALALCAGCVSEGAIRNFQAGLRLAAGAAMEAREHARRALELNRGLGDRAEEANSLRLLADAAFTAQGLCRGRQRLPGGAGARQGRRPPAQDHRRPAGARRGGAGAGKKTGRGGLLPSCPVRGRGGGRRRHAPPGRAAASGH